MYLEMRSLYAWQFQNLMVLYLRYYSMRKSLSLFFYSSQLFEGRCPFILCFFVFSFEDWFSVDCLFLYNKASTYILHNIALKRIIQSLKTHVWSTALYGCETWTIGICEKRILQALEMQCYQKMIKVRWVARVTQEEVLERIGYGRSLWKQVVKR